jgi:hypothetical protein
MSQLDTKDEGGLEEGIEQFENNRSKLVPVSEAIHYRRRAQSAEQKAESLGVEIEKVKAEAAETSKQLDKIRFEQALKDKLAAAGSIRATCLHIPVRWDIFRRQQVLKSVQAAAR